MSGAAMTEWVKTEGQACGYFYPSQPPLIPGEEIK